MLASIKKEYIPFECRICLWKLEGVKTHGLFDPWDPPWTGMESAIVEDLTKLTNIKVSMKDAFPKQICGMCYHRLKNACSFVKLALNNNEVLRQRQLYPHMEIPVSSEFVWPKPIQLDKNVAVFENAMDIEIKEELLSEEDQVDALVNNEYINKLDLIKIEPEEMTSQNPSNTNEAASTSKESQSLPNGEHKKPFAGPAVKEEPLSDDDADRLSLDCMLCAKAFNCLSGLKAHVIAHHSYHSVKRRSKSGKSPAKKPRRDTFVCATCRRRFFTRTDLMVHESSHGDLSCYTCGHHFQTFPQLMRHRARCEPPCPRPVRTLENAIRPVREAPPPQPPPPPPPRPESPEDEVGDLLLYWLRRDREAQEAELRLVAAYRHHEARAAAAAAGRRVEPLVVLADPPVELAEPPAELVEPPAELAEPPAQLAEPPAELAAPPAELAEPPVELAEPPVELAEPPADLAEPPAELAEPPAELSVDPPAEQPAELVEPPAELACPLCTERFTDAYILKIHTEIHHTECGEASGEPARVVNGENETKDDHNQGLSENACSSAENMEWEKSAVTNGEIIGESAENVGNLAEALDTSGDVDMPDEPVMSEEPALSEQPATPVISILSEEPTLPEEPVMYEVPTLPENPALSETPTLHENSALSETTHAIIEEPTSPEKPVLSDDPASPEEPQVTGRVTAVEADNIEAIFGVVNAESKSEVDLSSVN
ncbi:hypothetical protein JYU34_011137 [Plutella xylostella]|uniref:Uncharacterized protein n=1 Tax=Plutella xylostella TaxID=51655 RepID=A0ABQ7QG62_PLUXY|nr:hypothetical protein JYU34_011137 [Plutella xylostella]